METREDVHQQEQEILARTEEAETAEQFWRITEELWEVRRKLRQFVMPDKKAA